MNRTAVALGLTLLIGGFVFGAMWREQAHAGWEAERKAVLAKSDSVQAVSDSLKWEAVKLVAHHDSLQRLAREQQARADAANRESSAMRRQVIAIRDSAKAAGDTMVPMAVLDLAVATIDSQQVTITAQRQVIRTLAVDTATLAASARLNAQRAAHWEGRAEELEHTLSGYRAEPRPKLLGFLPAPSPTVQFVATVVTTLVVRDKLTKDE